MTAARLRPTLTNRLARPLGSRSLDGAAGPSLLSRLTRRGGLGLGLGALGPRLGLGCLGSCSGCAAARRARSWVSTLYIYVCAPRASPLLGCLGLGVGLRCAALLLGSSGAACSIWSLVTLCRAASAAAAVAPASLSWLRSSGLASGLASCRAACRLPLLACLRCSPAACAACRGCRLGSSWRPRWRLVAVGLGLGVLDQRCCATSEHMFDKASTLQQ